MILGTQLVGSPPSSVRASEELVAVLSASVTPGSGLDPRDFCCFVGEFPLALHV